MDGIGGRLREGAQKKLHGSEGVGRRGPAAE
jgi:hypothetical protein